jgi:hypothetical protein
MFSFGNFQQHVARGSADLGSCATEPRSGCTGAYLDVRASPDADAASDFSAPNSIAQTLGKEHAKSLPSDPLQAIALKQSWFKLKTRSRLKTK